MLQWGTPTRHSALAYTERCVIHSCLTPALLRTYATALLLASALLPTAGNVWAQGSGDAPGRELTLGVSFHDVSGRLGSAAALEIGYHPARRLLAAFRPDIGAMAAWDGAMYGFVGLSAPLSLPGGVTLTPSLGVGVFGAGERTDLGSAMEFRSAISLSVPGVTPRPLDVSFYHLSNAGLRRPNPGMEVLGIAYSLRW